MVKPVEEAMGPLDSVTVILIRALHISCVKLLRVEQRKVNTQDLCPPVSELSGPGFFVVTEQSLQPGVAVVIERDVTVSRNDVVAFQSPCGLYPESFPLWIFVPFKKNTGQDMAGTISKEYSIRQRPPTYRIFFNSRFQLVHRRYPI